MADQHQLRHASGTADPWPAARSPARIDSAARSISPWSGSRVGLAEVERLEAPGRVHVDVQVRDLEARDHQRHARRRPGVADHGADGARDRHDVLEQAVRGVEPLVDLLPRHHQHVSGPQGVDREEGDHPVVRPDETPRQLAVDDLREDGGHAGDRNEASTLPVGAVGRSPYSRSAHRAPRPASPPSPRSPGGSPDAALARHVLSPGRDLRRGRDQFRALQRGRRARHAVSVRRDRRGDPGRPAGAGRVRLARLPARHRPGAALRLPRRGPVRPGAGAALQQPQAAHRPVRQGPRRHARHHVRVGRGALLVPLRRPRRGQPRRLGAPRAQVRGDQPVLRLARRPPPAHAVPRHGDLRGPRQGAHAPAPGRPRGDAGHVLRRGPPGDDRPPPAPRHHGDRAHAGAPVHPRRRADPARAAQLLGLQHRRLPGPALRLRDADGHRAPGAGRARPGVQGDGARPARRGHRGDPRRRLQPHRRGQPPGPHAVDARHRQRRPTTASSRTTSATTWTTRAPATRSTSGTRTRCS